LLRGLHRELGLTVVMVTHDLDTLFDLSTRIAVLADQKVIVAGTARDVIAYPHPFIHEYFLGGRGQRAMEALHEGSAPVGVAGRPSGSQAPSNER
jgi:phospholipid/cholesterol/gamma-HCH transport system ATP-binding protein